MAGIGKRMAGCYTRVKAWLMEYAYLVTLASVIAVIVGAALYTDHIKAQQQTASQAAADAMEIAAAQSAGRLESKRVMKNAAYAKLYETIFKFMLAYADEPRTLVSMDGKGNRVYGHFNRYDFLCEDEYGELYWNDDFIFSCDDSSSLGKDREKMWAETRNNLASGTFGDPTSVSTLVLFWNIMERFHYPGAAEIKAQLMEQSEEQKLTSSEYGA